MTDPIEELKQAIADAMFAKRVTYRINGGRDEHDAYIPVERVAVAVLSAIKEAGGKVIMPAGPTATLPVGTHGYVYCTVSATWTTQSPCLRFYGEAPDQTIYVDALSSPLEGEDK